MTKKLTYAALSLGMLLATSCSDDKNPGEALENKTYQQEALTLTYNGTEMTGKTATLSVNENGSATLTLAGETLVFDSESETKNGALSIPTCGVIPGSPSLAIPIKLDGSETSCTFSGEYTTEYCSFSYTGNVNADKMNVDLKDVKLLDTTLAGTTVSLAGDWKLPEFEGSFYNDLHVVWKSDKKIPVIPEVMELPMETVLSMALVIPMVDGLSVAELLSKYLRDVKFGEDGNIYATYVDAESGNPQKSPAGVAQYVVAGEKILLFLNPQAIIAATATKSTRAGIDEVVSSILSQVLPMAANGIPLSYGKAISGVEYDDDMNTTPVYFDYPEYVSVYLGTDVLLPILKSAAPLLRDQAIKDAIINAATSNPDFAEMGSMVGGIIEGLPDVIEGTTAVEIGINLTR